jgi:hypothetical protein
MTENAPTAVRLNRLLASFCLIFPMMGLLFTTVIAETFCRSCPVLILL